MSISTQFASSLTDSGQLSVEVPKLAKPLESGGRSIPIEQIGEKAEKTLAQMLAHLILLVMKNFDV
ncbi:hypothetical protein KIN20_018797 [Parelaphostrongylus tenuis]|uniref:Uncharacterized protein n=1 Tax=Parelaphostrongylus tenuis TaxID=148309 RepID=A0AAD5N1J1_PARTN|nr:hypothetical protein KIN20_018797 [Parelaphostrongylus tenuis]